MSCSLAQATLAALALAACTPQASPPAAVDLTAPATTAAPAPPPVTPTADPTTTRPTTADPTTPPSTAPSTARPGEFVSVGGGLSVRLDVPAGPYTCGATVEFGLEFRNDSEHELRIYLIDPPIFRALQSDLAYYGTDDNFLGSQPDAHPHGHVVGERDFPAIAPGARRRFTQPFVVASNMCDTGPLEIRWIYRNRIDAWPGGVQTLDGTTRPLFGGGRIPGIWLGEFTVRAPLPSAH